MKIPSKDVIQADTPDRVMMAVDAVARGARNDKAIAAAIGGFDARQGRYYRRAAEVLGFMMRDVNGRSEVTTKGKEFASSEPAVKRALFTRAVLANPLFQRLLPFLEGKGVEGATREEAERFLAEVAELGAASMVERRVSSYLGWLVKLGLAKTKGRRWLVDHLPAAVPFVRYESDEEPIFPTRYDLQEYQEQAQRVAGRRHAIAYYVDQAIRERANTSHETLVNLMAERLRQRGVVPKANRYIDLSARWEGSDYLFEMKSTTEDNPHSQIRRGLSQLYEYRYIQNVRDARLVLVIEKPLSKKLGWMESYLVHDRGILLVWNGNGQFHCTREATGTMGFMS